MSHTKKVVIQHPVTIVLVEDDPGHARLIEKNLRRVHITNELIHLTDGQQAIEFILGQGEYAHKVRPPSIFVLLDLNLPIIDGYQVLQKMKSDERTRYIPVVVLTTTDDAHEINRCYQLGCNVYITKPVDYEKFAEAIYKFGMFLSILEIPEGHDV